MTQLTEMRHHFLQISRTTTIHFVGKKRVEGKRNNSQYLFLVLPYQAIGYRLLHA
ncbi:MAG: hypothetical protein AAF493_23245 [Pseudomonadota bacterium]